MIVNIKYINCRKRGEGQGRRKKKKEKKKKDANGERDNRFGKNSFERMFRVLDAR